MSDVSKVIDFLKEVDYSKFDVIVNIGGAVIVLGKQIIDILDKKGTMNQIEYLQIASKADLEKEIQRARLVKFIDENQ